MMAGMRFVVLGAGAVGGVVGGRLHEAGHDVVLVARGRHREVLARDGLTLRSPDRTVTLPVPVVAHPDELRLSEDDVVLLATKSNDTLAALGALRAAPGSGDVAVVCLQNGVANERVALRCFGRVYGVPVMLPAAYLADGVVEASSAPITGILDVGRYPQGVDDAAREISAAFASATFDSHPVADVMRWKWSKLVMNLGNAVQALCPASDAAGVLTTRARREGVETMRAAGIDFATKAEDADRRGSLLTPRPIDGRHRRGGSTWQSLARGTGTIETDYLNGEIALLGRLHGLPTPVNALLAATAAEAAHRRLPPCSTDAAELLARLG
jgi:2-dehydropantoate 2-reductase